MKQKFRVFHKVMTDVLNDKALECTERAELKLRLDYFVTGVAATNAVNYNDWDKDIFVPLIWQKYFIHMNKEYKEYIKLKKKI